MAGRVIEFVFKGDPRDLNKALGQIRGESGKTSEGLQETGEAGSQGFNATAAAAHLAKVGIAAAAAASVAAAAAVVKLGMAALDLSDELNQIAKKAKEVGTTVEDLDQLQGTFDLLTRGGVDAARAMQDFQRSMADAREGTGEALGALDRLGTTADHLASLPLPEAMHFVAERFDRLGDSASQTQAVLDIFGRSGRQLVPAFREGGAAIEVAGAKIEETGLKSGIAAAESEGLQDAILLMSRSFDALRRDVLEPLIPVLTLGAERVAGMLQALAGSEIVGGFASKIVGLATAMLGLTDEVAAFKREVDAAAEEGKTFADRYDEAFESVAALEQRHAALTGELERMAAVGSRATGAIAAKQEELIEITESLLGARADLASAERRLALDMEVTAAADEHAAAMAARRADREAFLARMAASRAEEEEALAAAIEEHAARLAEQADAQDDNADRAVEAAQRRIDALKEERQAALDGEAEFQAEMAAIKEEQHAAELARIDAERQARRDAQQQTLQAAASLAGSLISLSGTISDAVTEQYGEQSKEAKKAAMTAFVVNKIAAVAQAGVNTALAISNAIGNAPNPIVGAILGLAAGIAGVAATAAVVAQPPPSFHDGGLVGADEFDIRARRGEAVVPPQTVRAVGGEDGLRDLASGAGGQGDIVVVTKLDHRIYDVQTSRASARTGSPLDSALRATQPRSSGRHNPYRGNV